MVPPLSEKVGGRVPRVPRLIAPMPLSRLIVHINSYTIKNEKTFCFPYALPYSCVDYKFQTVNPGCLPS